MSFVRSCRGCGQQLPDKHLRTQLAPPDHKWLEVRTHDLACLVDFLCREEDADGQGELFTDPTWVRVVPGRGSQPAAEFSDAIATTVTPTRGRDA